MEVEIRPAVLTDAAGLARVHVETWRTAYQGLIQAATLESLSVAEREPRWLQQIETLASKAFIHVAELDGQVIGFATGGPEREKDAHYVGEIYALYLLQAYQRQGLGRQLVAASATSLRAHGLNNLLIWVLRDNPACRFYAALGGQPVREKETEIRGQILPEVGYGWDDLENFIGKDA